MPNHEKMRVKKTKEEASQDKLIADWKKNKTPEVNKLKKKRPRIKKRRKKKYETPSECLEHYQQYLRAKDVDGKN